MAKKKQSGYVVAIAFKDAKQYGTNSYEVGVDVNDFDPERLASLVKRGIVVNNETEAE